MKIIKGVFLTIVSAAVIVGISLLLLKRIEEQRILETVRNGQLMIDQELHDWGVCKNDSPVKIELYIRNNSQYSISGTLVLSATLQRKGIEEEFLKEFINCYGEEKLQKELKEELDAKGSIGRVESVYNYILRGRKLPQGQKYEPSTKIVDKDYEFRFRKKILVNSGELIKIDHYEEIPFKERGNLLRVKIENIEF